MLSLATTGTKMPITAKALAPAGDVYALVLGAASPFWSNSADFGGPIRLSSEGGL